MTPRILVELPELRAADAAASSRTLDTIAEIARSVGPRDDVSLVLPEPTGSGPALDPSTVAAALSASVTVPFAIEASTHRHAPYNLARRVLTLTHLTGRPVGVLLRDLGVDPVTKAARAVGPGTSREPAGTNPADLAREYASVLRALWASFPRSALIGDREAGIVVDTARLAPAAFEGKTYRVAGALNVPAAPVGEPWVVSGGATVTGTPEAIAAQLRGAEADSVVIRLAAELEGLERELRTVLDLVDREPEADYGFATYEVHAGAVPDAAHGARITPLYLSAGFVFDDFDHAKARFAGTDPGLVYSRTNNPTNIAVEERIAALEHGIGATLVGSGQAAATVALLSVLGAGDHFLSTASIYEGTRALFRGNFARFGIEVEFIDRPNDPDAWRARVRPNTKLFFGEVIPNPKNDIIDVASIAETAHALGLPFAVDSTLATPYLLRPIDHGADIVIHSTSKFLAGHGATIGGVVVDAGSFDWAANPERYGHLQQPVPASDEESVSWIEKFGTKANFAYTRAVVAGRLGPSFSPFNAFELQQGLETLSLRVDRHSRNALTIARYLERQPEVSSVDYTGLESNPYYDLARRQFPKGQGSVFAFTLRGGQDAARTFYNSVELFTRMTHVGDVRSLILHPATTTHSKLSQRERDEAGIHPGLLRLSVGIEDVTDLLADLDRAFRVLRGERPPKRRRLNHPDEPTQADGL